MIISTAPEPHDPNSAAEEIDPAQKAVYDTTGCNVIRIGNTHRVMHTLPGRNKWRHFGKLLLHVDSGSACKHAIKRSLFELLLVHEASKP
jgi:hypothetical protein